MWPFKKKAAEPVAVGNWAAVAAECDHPVQSRVSQYAEVDGKRKVIRIHCELCGASLLPPEATAA
jgi:hypothetical protein